MIIDDPRPARPPAPACGYCQWVFSLGKWHLSVSPSCPAHKRA